MHWFDPFLFWSIMGALTFVSALTFRRLARLVDQQTDALLEKFDSKPIDPKYRLALPMMVVGMLVVMVVVWVIASAAVLWGPDWLWNLAGTVSLFRALRYVGVAGALAFGVMAGTMAFPGVANALGGEAFRWAYLRSNYVARHGKQASGSLWYRASLSTFYLMGAILLIWVSTADYVRVEPGNVCRHQFDWIGEACVPYTELESVTIDERRDFFGVDQEVLVIAAHDGEWVVAATGMGTTRAEINQLQTRLMSQAGP